MSIPTKRSYNSALRKDQSNQTKFRILACAKALFESRGFEHVTIEKIAQDAGVSVPTIYSIFQSKRGILRALMDKVLPTDQFNALVEKSLQTKSPQERLCISAQISRQLYDAERAQIDILQGASLLAPEFKELEKEKEMRRYKRQEVTIKAMSKEKSLVKGLTQTKARAILWALTGRDMYRMFVVEQGWTSDEYEKWLSKILINTLVNKEIESNDE